jgi:hypothetical protein
MGAIGKRKTKVVGTFVGGERTVWKVFKRWQFDRMHEKKTKTSGNFGKENKSWRVTGSNEPDEHMHEMKTKLRTHL